MEAEKRMEAIRAIRRYCLDCMAGSWRLIEGCTTRDCPLWVYRFGVRPEEAAAAGREVGL